MVSMELTDSYLYRDLLSFDTLRKPDVIVRLLKALSLQIGSQVSYNELASLLGLTSKTVEKYLDILEKSYIIFRLGSFSRNMRNELKLSRKIYFWDLGIRNAVIGNMAPLENHLFITSRQFICIFCIFFCKLFVVFAVSSVQSVDY